MYGPYPVMRQPKPPTPALNPDNLMATFPRTSAENSAQERDRQNQIWNNAVKTEDREIGE